MKFLREYPGYFKLNDTESLWKILCHWASPLDPETGMSTDLVLVDEKVKALLSQFSQNSFNEISTLLYSLFEELKVTPNLVSLQIQSTQGLSWKLENKNITRGFEFYFQQKYKARIEWFGLDDIELIEPQTFFASLESAHAAFLNKLTQDNPNKKIKLSLFDEVLKLGIQN